MYNIIKVCVSFLADVHSPIVCLLSGMDIDLDQQLPANMPTAWQRLKIVSENPVPCAR